MSLQARVGVVRSTIHTLNGMRKKKKKFNLVAPTGLIQPIDTEPPSLSEILKAVGLDAAAVECFIQQDVPDVATACELSLDEIRQIVGNRSTVGKAHQLFKLLQQEGEHAVAIARLRSLLQPGDTNPSALTRTMLQMGAEELKAANLARLTSESVFSSLMLTIAIGALIENPDIGPCVHSYGTQACNILEEAYISTFGLASSCFLGACLITLGAVNLLHNVANSETCHFITVTSEAYASMSFLLISLGLMFGLLPGSCVNVFLRFPDRITACIFTTSIHWIIWAWQFVRSMGAIKRVYGLLPGYTSMGGFLADVTGLKRLPAVVVVRKN